MKRKIKKIAKVCLSLKFIQAMNKVLRLIRKLKAFIEWYFENLQQNQFSDSLIYKHLHAFEPSL